MLDLRDPDAVARKLEEALGGFEPGGPVPVGARELLLEFARSMAEGTPYDAGLSDASWLLAKTSMGRAIERLEDERRGVQCREVNRALRNLRRLYKLEAWSARGRPLLMWRGARHAGSAADELERLLIDANVARRRRGRGTPMSEPVIVLRGRHLRDFELLDSEANGLGSAVRVGKISPWNWDRPAHYAIRDARHRPLLVVRDVGRPPRPFRATKRIFEISEPDGQGTITVERRDRRTYAASIASGSDQIAMMRREGRRSGFLLEDHAGRLVARILIARKQASRQLVDLVVEVEDGASTRLRAVALSASLIADRELVESGSG